MHASMYHVKTGNVLTKWSTVKHFDCMIIQVSIPAATPA